jgi:hypothetical protein
MSKRGQTKFPRRPQDAYDTPPEVVAPLLPFLREGTLFHEPCAGAYALAGELERHGHQCCTARDVAPRDGRVFSDDGANATPGEEGQWLITNPPFEWSALKPLMDAWVLTDVGFEKVALLLPLDMIANQRFAPYCPHIEQIVMVGRVRWMPGSDAKSMENFAWIIFGDEYSDEPVVGQRLYVGRAEGAAA